MKSALFILILILYSVFVYLPTSTVLAQGCVDINTASLDQLDTLTGIGPVYAQRIIDGRPYSSVDDLDRVKGIGPATLQKIKDQGLASVSCAPAPQGNNNQDTSVQTNSNDQIDKTAEDGLPPASVVYPSGVYINEILPNPKGSDETDEWIELYNSNAFDVDLSGWQLQDRAGTIKTHSIPSVTMILANGFLIFGRPDTKIMLNNEGDGVSLLAPSGKVANSVSFVNAPLGQSYNRSSNNWVWGVSLTPGTVNIITNPATKVTTKTPLPSSGSSDLPNTEKNDNNSNIESKDLTAALGNSLNSNTNPWPLFFIVLAVTIILAIIVLIIKIRFTDVTKP